LIISINSEIKLIYPHLVFIIRPPKPQNPEKMKKLNLMQFNKINNNDRNIIIIDAEVNFILGMNAIYL
jgi:hypothetical protein